MTTQQLRQNQSDSLLCQMRDLLEDIHTLAKLAEPIRPPWTPMAYDLDLLFLRAKNHLIRFRDSIDAIIKNITDDPQTTWSLDDHEGG